MHATVLIPMVSAIGLLATNAPGSPSSEARISERPWVDVRKFPLDQSEAIAAKIVASGQQPAHKLFVLVRRPDGVTGSSSVTAYGSVEVVALTGKARVQIGNANLVKTFSVDGSLSICEVSPAHMQCTSMGKVERFVTN
jgi:hypothetical protein